MSQVVAGWRPTLTYPYLRQRESRATQPVRGRGSVRPVVARVPKIGAGGQAKTIRADCTGPDLVRPSEAEAEFVPIDGIEEQRGTEQPGLVIRQRYAIGANISV